MRVGPPRVSFVPSWATYMWRRSTAWMKSAVDFVAWAEKKGSPVRRQKNLARKLWPWASGGSGADQSKSHSSHGEGLGMVPRGCPSCDGWCTVVVMREWRMGRLVAAARRALHAVTPSVVGLSPMSRPRMCAEARRS